MLRRERVLRKLFLSFLSVSALHFVYYSHSAEVLKKAPTSLANTIPVRVSPQSSPSPTPSLTPTAQPKPVASSHSTTGEWVELYGSVNKDEKIKNLSWLERIVKAQDADNNKLKVKLKGRFQDPDWSLLYLNRKIELGKNGQFNLEVELKGEFTPFVLQAVTHLGKVQNATFNLVYRRYKVYIAEKERLAKGGPKKSWFVNAGIGVSSIQYNQSDMNEMKQLALTAKISWSGMLFSPRWDYGLTAFGTALTLSNTHTGADVRFIGVNGRIGYVLPFISEPWKVSLMLGGYYTTMIVNVTDGSLPFGYKNLQGPMLFPVIRRAFVGGSSIASYFKFSPITDNFSFLSLQNHEIAGGMAWNMPAGNGHSISVSVDVSNFSLLIQGLSVVNNTYTFGLSYTY